MSVGNRWENIGGKGKGETFLWAFLFYNTLTFEPCKYFTCSKHNEKCALIEYKEKQMKPNLQDIQRKKIKEPEYSSWLYIPSRMYFKDKKNCPQKTLELSRLTSNNIDVIILKLVYEPRSSKWGKRYTNIK